MRQDAGRVLRPGTGLYKPAFVARSTGTLAEVIQLVTHMHPEGSRHTQYWALSFVFPRDEASYFAMMPSLTWYLFTSTPSISATQKQKPKQTCLDTKVMTAIPVTTANH
jgi:hypothetical protein